MHMSTLDLSRNVNNVERTLKQNPIERIGLWRRRARARGISSVIAANAGATAVGALALGAAAIGALAISALAIRRVFIGRARVRALVIDELVVNRLTVRNVASRAFEPVGRGAPAIDEAAGMAGTASRGNGSALHPATAELSPGDEAAFGTPGTGEQTCSICGGSGLIDSQRCENCAGSGKVTQGIGGG
jgi:hypothetical protein